MTSVKDEIKNLPTPNDQTELDIEEQNITVEKLKYMLPKGSKVKVTQATVDMVNKIIDESTCHKGLMEERLFTYLHLLGPGIGIKQLLKGIQFVTLSMTPGMTQSKAYMITFPDKAQEIIDQNRDPASLASMYAATKVPSTILQGIQIGPSITYAPLRHQIVEKYIQLMNGKAADGPASPTVQLNASIALMDYIKVPQELTINWNQGVDAETKSQNERLVDEISRLADLQAQRLSRGESLNDIQKVGIIVEAEIIDED